VDKGERRKVVKGIRGGRRNGGSGSCEVKDGGGGEGRGGQSLEERREDE